jgi:hypothetical protein
VTSTVDASATSPPPSDAATVAAAPASRSATTTQAPSAASRRAIARPMPEPAPVLEEIDDRGSGRHRHRQVVFEPELVVRASSARRRRGR